LGDGRRGPSPIRRQKCSFLKQWTKHAEFRRRRGSVRKKEHVRGRGKGSGVTKIKGWFGKHVNFCNVVNEESWGWKGKKLLSRGRR